jgi:hypothetical protein
VAPHAFAVGDDERAAVHGFDGRTTTHGREHSVGVVGRIPHSMSVRVLYR